MADALVCDRVRLRHDGAPVDAVGPVSLRLGRGERVLLLGPSGVGKSSLLLAATGLLPGAVPGTRQGEIMLDGQRVETRTPAEWADTCGHLFQDAGQTLAGFTVEDEIAFAPENRAVPPGDMPRLIDAAMARVGIPAAWKGRRIASLSGGERQLVAIAALLAQGAPITLADEPAASLAPDAAARMADLLLAPGRTTLVVEHRPGPILDRIDRWVALGRSGRVIAEGRPSDLFGADTDRLAAEGIALPLAARLHRDHPDLVGPSGAILGDRGLADRDALRDRLLAPPTGLGDRLVTLTDAACAPAFGPVVLRDMTFSLRAGEVVAILGPNGAGKSTLAACLAGLIRPRAGQRKGPAGAVAFQNPEAHFSRDSVKADLATAVPDAAERARVLGRWGLAEVAERHPFTLSQGQKRRLALALLAEAGRWPLLVLDEPTAGLDATGEAVLRARIRDLAAAGHAVCVITHDLDFALAVAPRAILVDGGTARFDGPCADLMRDRARLSASGLLPPEAAPFLAGMGETC